MDNYRYYNEILYIQDTMDDLKEYNFEKYTIEHVNYTLDYQDQILNTHINGNINNIYMNVFNNTQKLSDIINNNKGFFSRRKNTKVIY